MEVEREARLWQVIGAMGWAAGGGMLLMLFWINGVVKAPDLNLLSMGLAASFMMLAGIAGFVFGRVLHHMAFGYQQREAVLWRLLGLVCCACGGFAVLFVAISTGMQNVSLGELVQGQAGGFLVMAGVICLLGNRVMHRESEKFAGKGSAKAAGA